MYNHYRFCILFHHNHLPVTHYFIVLPVNQTVDNPPCGGERLVWHENIN